MKKFYNATNREIVDQAQAEWDRSIAAGIASLGANELRERYLEVIGQSECDPSGASWVPVRFMYEVVCDSWGVQPD